MKVVLVGAGAVATHMAQRLCSVGVDVVQVYSRSEQSAQLLALQTGADWITSLKKLRGDVDVIVFAVTDDALPEMVHIVMSKLTADQKPLLVHTSGATPVKVFAAYEGASGVVYPLQTFSRTRMLDFSRVPLFIEAQGNAQDDIPTVADFARLFSPLIYEADTAMRTRLHVAAVFACNFVNHLYELGGEVLHEAGLPFDVLLPLIEETAYKVCELPPCQAQTGPAVRNDQTTIQRHLTLLQQDGNEHLVHLYKYLTESIHNGQQQKS